MQEYSDGIYYSNLDKFIFENPEIMDSFSIKNLYTLIASAYTEEEKKMVNERIAKKLEYEEFFASISTHIGVININGFNLNLEKMTNDDIKITGKIESIELERMQE